MFLKYNIIKTNFNSSYINPIIILLFYLSYMIKPDEEEEIKLEKIEDNNEEDGIIWF